MPGNWSRLWSLRYICRIGTLGNNRFFLSHRASLNHLSSFVKRSFTALKWSFSLSAYAVWLISWEVIWQAGNRFVNVQERPAGTRILSCLHSPLGFDTWCSLMLGSCFTSMVWYSDLPPALGPIVENTGIRVKKRSEASLGGSPIGLALGKRCGAWIPSLLAKLGVIYTD